jgi:hypothetical protein
MQLIIVLVVLVLELLPHNVHVLNTLLCKLIILVNNVTIGAETVKKNPETVLPVQAILTELNFLVIVIMVIIMPV